MKNMIRWGILATGGIAHKFVQDLRLLEGAEAAAVGSRSLEKAESFAKQYGIAKAYGSYEALVNDPEIDIIYVATPHSSHKECTLLCLRAGKAVLCEKAFTVNAREAEEIVHYARQAKLFLMEAMWTRYLPAVVKVREWLSKGVIGDIKMLKADFGFRCGWDPGWRLLNRSLAGGALLDVGIYPVSFTSMVFGTQPAEIKSMPHIGTTGVDEQFLAMLGYGEGKMASLSGAIRTSLINDAWIFGTEGNIHIPNFWCAKSAVLSIPGKESEVYNTEFEGNGYHFEAAHAMQCLKEGKLESEIMTLDESLAIMRTMDRIREHWALKYSQDS